MSYYVREDFGTLQRNVYQILGWSVHEDWDGLTEEQQIKARKIDRAFASFKNEHLWDDPDDDDDDDDECVPTVSIHSEGSESMEVERCIVCGQEAKWMCSTCKRAPFCGETCYRKE